MRPVVRRPGSCARSRGRGGCRSRRAARSRVPPRIGRSWPQPEQRAQRCWQARHQGCPVVLEITQGAGRGRRSRRSSSSRAGSVWQSGPSGVRTPTGRRRPQSMQVSWLAGSVIRQFGHSGRPCSSRAGGLADRAAAERRAGPGILATQLRHSHCPSMRRCRRMTRSQRGTGRADDRLCARRRRAGRSAAARTGTGASAPAPVSRSGRSSTPRPVAAAVRRWARPPCTAAVDRLRADAGSTPVDDVDDDDRPGRGRRRAGSWPHRGRPVPVTEATGRALAAGGAGFGPAAADARSTSPDRGVGRVRSCLPHSAQTGGEIVVAPARRSAISRSADRAGRRGPAVGAAPRAGPAGPGRGGVAWPGRRRRRSRRR